MKSGELDSPIFGERANVKKVNDIFCGTCCLNNLRVFWGEKGVCKQF